MKTRTKTSTWAVTIYENESDRLSSYKESEVIDDALIRFFPIWLALSLVVLFSFVIYSSIKTWFYSLAVVFTFLSLIAGLYAAAKWFKSRNTPYTFYWDPRQHETLNIKNSYNYSKTQHLTKITKSKFWKFIYFSEYYNKILFSILGMPLIGIMIMLFTMESFWTLPSTWFILLLIFWPALVSCVRLCTSLIKTRSEIYSKKNNFYYISRNSKNLWFSIENNTDWWGDYIFRK